MSALINPRLAAGQIHGGVAQGFAQALYEEVSYDRDSGQLLTGSEQRCDVWDVLGARHCVVEQRQETPSPTNPECYGKPSEKASEASESQPLITVWLRRTIARKRRHFELDTGRGIFLMANRLLCSAIFLNLRTSLRPEAALFDQMAVCS
jgi:hypothetical protein